MAGNQRLGQAVKIHCRRQNLSAPKEKRGLMAEDLETVSVAKIY